MLMLVDWMDPKHTDEGIKFAQYCRKTLASMHTDDGICKDPAAVCSVSSPDKLWREMLTLLCWCRCQCRLHLQGHGDRYPQCPLLVSSTDWHGKLFFLHHVHLALQQTQAARALRSDAGAFCNVSLACTACMHSGCVADHCVWTGESGVARRVGGPENLARLRKVKTHFDPDNMFRNHHFTGLMDTDKAL